MKTIRNNREIDITGSSTRFCHKCPHAKVEICKASGQPLNIIHLNDEHKKIYRLAVRHKWCVDGEFGDDHVRSQKLDPHYVLKTCDDGEITRSLIDAILISMWDHVGGYITITQEKTLLATGMSAENNMIVESLKSNLKFWGRYWEMSNRYGQHELRR